MTAFSAVMPIAQTLNTLYGFQDAKHLVDIGGGYGILTTDILRLNPHLKGTSFDLVRFSFSPSLYFVFFKYSLVPLVNSFYLPMLSHFSAAR